MNPVAVMMTRAKLQEYGDSGVYLFGRRVAERAEAELNSGLAASAEALLNQSSASRSLEGIQLWFHSRTVLELAVLLRVIEAELDERFLTLGKACFSSILRACSSQEKHWGYICDNVRPKSLRYKNAIRHFERAVRRFAEDYARFDKLYESNREGRETIVHYKDAVVIEGNAIAELANLESLSVKLIITSPPYLDVTDYLNSQRLSLLWLFPGMPTDLRSQEIGARYKRFRKDSLTPYLQDMAPCIYHMARVLEVHGYCCLVLGESAHHPPYVRELVRLLTENGFAIVTRLERRIAEKRSLSPRIMDEAIILACKERNP